MFFSSLKRAHFDNNDLLRKPLKFSLKQGPFEAGQTPGNEEH